MTSVHRRQRGWETQRIVAGYFAANGWPFATDAGAGRPGCDILGVPGLGIEVKARRDFSPLAWVRQAGKHAAGLPMCVHRPDGMGPATVASWPVTLRLEDLVTLLRQAGYGSTVLPEQAENSEIGDFREPATFTLLDLHRTIGEAIDARREGDETFDPDSQLD